MRRLSLSLAAVFALGAPVAAQSLSTLLPLISFPDPVTTISTKGCGATQQVATCRLEE